MANVKTVLGATTLAAAFAFPAVSEAGSHGYPAGILKDYKAFVSVADKAAMQTPAMKGHAQRLANLTADYRDGVYKIDPKDVPEKDRAAFHVARLVDYNNIVDTLVTIRENYRTQRPADTNALKFLAQVDVYPCRDDAGTMNVLATMQGVLPRLSGSFGGDSYVHGKVVHIQEMAGIPRGGDLSKAFGRMIVNNGARETSEAVAAALMLSAYAETYKGTDAAAIPPELKTLHRKDPVICTVPGQRI